MTITVGITTYNQARFLDRTLQSVFAQTRPPDEIVVVDDGSTDDTQGVLHRYRDRVRTIRQPNSGIAAARNRVVSAAAGDLVALLDGDDLWHPDKLRRCLEAAQRLPAGVIVHDVETITEDESRVVLQAPVVAALGHAAQGPTRRDVWAALVDANFIWTTSQVIVDRALYLEAGMSNPRYRIGSDYDLYLRLARRTPFLLIPEILVRWRQHDASASGAGADRGVNWRREIVKVLHAHAAHSERPAAARLREQAARTVADINADLYCEEFERGSVRTAARLFRVAWECGALSSAALGVAVLCPFRVRRAVAALTGHSVSTALSASAEAGRQPAARDSAH